MIKIYELIKQNAARLVFSYCGVKINADFGNGNTFINRNAQFTTNNRFFQDAIENDSRFGVSIKLAKSIKEDSDEEKTVPEEKKEDVPTKKAGSKKTKNIQFESVNDFMEFLTSEGDEMSDPSELDSYLKKYNATIKA